MFDMNRGQCKRFQISIVTHTVKMLLIIVSHVDGN